MDDESIDQAETAAFLRLKELAELAGRDGLDDEEVRVWVRFLEELSTMDDDTLASDLEECAWLDDPSFDDPSLGWIEDERGGAVFRPYCWTWRDYLRDDEDD
jgi:hypothetical protein